MGVLTTILLLPFAVIPLPSPSPSLSPSPSPSQSLSELYPGGVIPQGSTVKPFSRSHILRVLFLFSILVSLCAALMYFLGSVLPAMIDPSSSPSPSSSSASFPLKPPLAHLSSPHYQAYLKLKDVHTKAERAGGGGSDPATSRPAWMPAAQAGAAAEGGMKEGGEGERAAAGDDVGGGQGSAGTHAESEVAPLAGSGAHSGKASAAVLHEDL